MAQHEPCIILISGIMASGKSTVAQKLAERLDKSVHLHGDDFRVMIVNGRVEMDPKASEEALRQLRLRYRLSTTVAHLYCEAGFTVVYQDVIVGPMLNDVVSDLKGKYSLYVVLLTPSQEVIAEREAGRDKVGYGAWSIAQLDHELRANTPRLGLWLDSSLLSVEETVDAVLARLDEARV